MPQANDSHVYSDLVREAQELHKGEENDRANRRRAEVDSAERERQALDARAEAGAKWLSMFAMPEIKLATEQLRAQIKIEHRLNTGMPEPYQSMIGFKLTSTKDKSKEAGYELVADDKSFELHAGPGGKIPALVVSSGNFGPNEAPHITFREMFKAMFLEFLRR
jgi:hypothetical protein